MLRIFISFIICLLLTSSHAAKIPNQPLPPEKAFEFSSYLNQKKQLVLEWHMAPGYYLYKEKLHVSPTSTNQVPIGKIQLPPGKIKKDNVFGTYQIYLGNLKIHLNLASASQGILNLTVSYQGCSAQGFCYAMQKKEVRINTAQKSGYQKCSSNQ